MVVVVCVRVSVCVCVCVCARVCDSQPLELLLLLPVVDPVAPRRGPQRPLGERARVPDAHRAVPVYQLHRRAQARQAFTSLSAKAHLTHILVFRTRSSARHS